MIMSWNVHGDLALKLTGPSFSKFIFDHDICLLQETHLIGSQEDSLKIVEGFSTHAVSRPYRDDLGRPGGGVIAFVRSSCNVSIRADITGNAPDIVLLEHDSLWILCAYIPPTTSAWHKWATVDPWQKFTEVVTLCAVTDTKPILIMGDLNARVGTQQSKCCLPLP